MGLWLWLLVTPSHDAHCEHTGVQGSRGHFSSVLWEPLGSIFAKVRVKLSSFECFTKPSQEPGFNYSDKCIPESDVTGGFFVQNLYPKEWDDLDYYQPLK